MMMPKLLLASVLLVVSLILVASVYAADGDGQAVQAPSSDTFL